MTTALATPDIDKEPVVNGPDLRKTHPNLYRASMTFAVMSVALGLNFWILSPTFLIYDQPNQLWGTIFLFLGAAELVLLNVWRRLRAVRAVMGFAVFYLLFLAAGTSQPFFEGQGSLQLPILYVSVAVPQIWFLIEPYFNPWTSRP